MIIVMIADVSFVREGSVTEVNYAKTYTAILLCAEMILIIVERIDYKIPIKIGVLLGYQVQDMIDIGNKHHSRFQCPPCDKVASLPRVENFNLEKLYIYLYL